MGKGKKRDKKRNKAYDRGDLKSLGPKDKKLGRIQILVLVGMAMLGTLIVVMNANSN